MDLDLDLRLRLHLRETVEGRIVSVLRLRRVEMLILRILNYLGVCFCFLWYQLDQLFFCR